MIHFVLNDLCCPAGVCLDASLQFQGLILNLDRFITFTRTQTTEKRQTSLLGVIRTVFFDNLGIEHHGICGCSSTLVEKRDDAFFTPIIFAAIPTQRFLCTTSVSSKSCETGRSSLVATSDFPERNIGSCINSLIIETLSN